MNIKPAANLVIGVVLLCIGAAPALAQPILTLEGSCPGDMRAEVTRAMPNRAIMLLFAPRQGSYRFPPGHWCAGVTLGLNWRGLRIVTSTVCDQNGFGVFKGAAAPAACGGYLQALNYPSGNCETSNVVQIP